MVLFRAGTYCESWSDDAPAEAEAVDIIIEPSVVVKSSQLRYVCIIHISTVREAQFLSNPHILIL